jgi:hypothetical protein
MNQNKAFQLEAHDKQAKLFATVQHLSVMNLL